jgi:hypothetical protein
LDLTRKRSQVQPGRAHQQASDQEKRCRAHYHGADPPETLVSSLSGPVPKGCVPDGERFPCLTFLFRTHSAATRSSAPSSGTCTPRTARPAPSPAITSPCGRPTPSCAAAALPGGRHPGRPRGVPGRPARPSDSQHRRHLPQGPQDPLRLVGRGKGDSDQPDPVRRLVTRKGEHPGPARGLEPRVSGFARRRCVS